jgi:DNA topoisomerase-1
MPPPLPNLASAKAAGLHYACDTCPGISRQRQGKDFTYTKPHGRPVKDPDDLTRIRSLAIPPAWTHVWISPDPLGHIQATGRDARGRKQYKYHPRWRQTRDSNKYEKMIAFAKALPRIRQNVEKHLRLPGLPREKVLAAVVKLLETTLIRVGNAEYAKDNHSFGLTTMRDGHADIHGDHVRFHFKGKSGIKHSIEFHDPRLARIVKNCRDLPGQELFQYLDDEGNVRDIGSADVNDYLREIAGEEFSAKDFRTWAGTVLAAMALREFESFSSKKQANHNIVAAVESVAKKLGNTKAVCRKCYIHPAILDSYLEGTLVQTLKRRIERKLSRNLHDLPPEEAAVLAILRERLAQGENKAGTAARRKAG